MRKTKIICTIGPACADKKTLKEMIAAGMNVARFNMSHGDYESHHKMIEALKAARKEMNVPVAIMIDTKGPEIRIRQFKEGAVDLIEGQKFVLTTKNVVGNKDRVSVSIKNFNTLVKPKDKIMLNDGLIVLKVDSVCESDVICTVVMGGKLSNNKSVVVPNIKLDVPYLSPTDKKDILFGLSEGADMFSLSFVSSADDVLSVRNFLDKNGGEDVIVCSKIESKLGVDNVEKIIEQSDCVMVARGDLGVEIEFEKVPQIQKFMIKKCLSAGKTIITATEMLESMITNIRPTRAEISDIANAVYDGTSAIMLSAETSAGANPVLCVETMAKIAEDAEKTIDYNKELDFKSSKSVSSSIGYAACELSHSLNAKAIIATTKTGFAARSVSRFRPSAPIIACTPCQKVYNQLALEWGVVPIIDEWKEDTDKLLKSSRQQAYKTKLVSKGDLVVQTASVTAGKSGSNLLVCEHI